MKSIARVLAAAIFGTALAATPLLAQTVTIDYDHTVNFLKFKTYTWEKIHATDPNVEDRINIALNRDSKRGRQGLDHFPVLARGHAPQAHPDLADIAATSASSSAPSPPSTRPRTRRNSSTFTDLSAASTGNTYRVPQGFWIQEPPCRMSLWTRSSSIYTTPRPTNSCGAAPLPSRWRRARTKMTAPSTTPSLC